MCKGTSKDKLKQFDGKEGAALLSLSISTAYHNNKDGVTFSDEAQTKTPPHWIQKGLIFYSYGGDHNRYGYTRPECNDTMAVLQ